MSQEIEEIQHFRKYLGFPQLPKLLKKKVFNFIILKILEKAKHKTG